MRAIIARRMRNTVLLILATITVVAWYHTRRSALGDISVATGWLLFGLILFLALYNVRKKLSFLRLGSSATWLQLHAYAGVFSVVLFLLHITLRPPSGWFESMLALAFSLLAVSGLVGLYLSRAIPPRLSRRGEEVIYERIPQFRHALRREAEELVLRSVEETRSTAVADFYDAYLNSFFAATRGVWRHVWRPESSSGAWSREMDELATCLGDEERRFLDEIRSRVRAKDDLDFHHANQALLKYWLFVHVPLTYVLLLLVAVHVVLVHAFGAVP
jgi:hypothetical protein